MDKEKFLDEIKGNSIEELELIYDTQKDLYSNDEMELIKERLDFLVEKKKKEDYEKIKDLLPKEIECPKCFGPNDFKNDECIYCGDKLDKSKYYTIEFYENEKNDEGEVKKEKDSFTFQYVISFIIPFVGLIVGAILLADERKERQSIGKTCIILGIISIIVNYIIIMASFFS